MTGEDLWYKPGVVEKAKFEYSALAKVFNKGLEKEDKKEELLKGLKNIEDKNEKQLEIIKNKDSKDLSIKSVTNILDKEQEAKNMITKVKNQDKKVNIKNAEMKQAEFNVVLNALKKYSPKKSEYIKEKMDLLDNVKNFSVEGI